MKCVILAAGRGERMMPLTTYTPKPLLTVLDEPLINWVLSSLPPKKIDEIIIVVKYRANQIKQYIGKSFENKKIKYVMGSSRGNAYSFLATRKYLKDERFLLIYGDEIPEYRDVQKCMSRDLSILTFDGGKKDGVMVLNTDIFNYKPKNGNFSSMVDLFIKEHKVSMVKPTYNFLGEIIL